MSIWNDLFGGFFDFNGDGKTDIGEEWIAFNILNEIAKSDEETETNSLEFDEEDY